MAYRRSIVTRATLLTRHRFAPSFPCTHSDDDRKRRQDSVPLHPSLFGTAVKSPLGFGPSQLFCASPMGSALIGRNMSTAVGEGADKIEYMTDVADVLTDRTADVVTTAALAVSEVAIAAADSAYPVAALQYFIEGVHNFTGFNWWASIALTTLLIHGATVPLLIIQLKATTKISLLRSVSEEIKQEMEAKGMDPKAVADGQQRKKVLFNRHGVTPFTPLRGLLFQGPVFLSFFLAISNMVEKVPSFKQGGAFWFTDLTTPDSLYIFPALTALSFWITVEIGTYLTCNIVQCNMQEGMEGNPVAKTMKKVSRVLAAVTIPITMNFPKALFCYWVTSDIFSLMYGLVLKAPGVKKFLKIPYILIAPPSTTTSGKPEFSFSEAMKKYMAAKKNAATQHATSAQRVTSLPSETSKPAGNQNLPSSAVLSQRLRSLESQVKGKKKKEKKKRGS